MSRWLSLLLSVLACVGCASVPLTSPALDASAKAFAPPPSGAAYLYILRTSDLGGTLLYQVFLDGQVLGSLGTGTYLRVALAPGSHQLTCFTAEAHAVLAVAAVAGEHLFVRVVPRFGLASAYSRVSLARLDGTAGREAVRETARVQGVAETMLTP